MLGALQADLRGPALLSRLRGFCQLRISAPALTTDPCDHGDLMRFGSIEFPVISLLVLARTISGLNEPDYANIKYYGLQILKGAN